MSSQGPIEITRHEHLLFTHKTLTVLLLCKRGKLMIRDRYMAHQVCETFRLLFGPTLSKIGAVGSLLLDKAPGSSPCVFAWPINPIEAICPSAIAILSSL